MPNLSGLTPTAARAFERLTSPGFGGIDAWHGSPTPEHFDKFDSSYIGTGEGRQAIAMGHYLAQRKDVADEFRRNLSYRRLRDQWREELGDDAEAYEVMGLVGESFFDPRQERFLRSLDDVGWLGFDYPSQAVSSALAPGDYRKMWDATDEMVAARDNLGTGYQAKIMVPEKSMLDWNAPVNADPEMMGRFTKALDSLPANELTSRARGALDTGATGAGAYRLLGDAAVDYDPGLMIGGKKHYADSAASLALSEAGVPGVKYLDSHSRAAGDGTRNYVVFPNAEDQIRILRKYSMLPIAGAGAAAMQD